MNQLQFRKWFWSALSELIDEVSDLDELRGSLFDEERQDAFLAEFKNDGSPLTDKDLVCDSCRLAIHVDRYHSKPTKCPNCLSLRLRPWAKGGV